MAHRDGVPVPIANRLQRRIFAEHVHRAILERQIPAVSIPRDHRFVKWRRRRSVLEHRIRPSGSGRRTHVVHPASFGQNKIRFLVLLRRPEKHRVWVRHAAPERAGHVIARVVRPGQRQRNNIGEKQIRLVHHEDAC